MGLEEGGRKRITAMSYLVGLPSYKNLGEALEDLLARHLSASRKRQVEAALEEQTPAWLPERTARRSQASEDPPSAYQQDRLARYQQMIQLHEQGMTQGAIAQQIGVSLNTVRALARQRVS